MNLRHRLIEWLGGEVKAKGTTLNFSIPKDGRCSVSYGGSYLCRCSEQQKEEAQKFFDDNHTGDIAKTSVLMKEQFNQRVQGSKVYKPKRGRKLTPYMENEVYFEKSQTKGRCRVRVRDMGEVHQLCSCGVDQKDDVARTYKMLVAKGHSLDEIKALMKPMYNRK